MLLLQFLALMIGLMQFVPCVAIDNPDTPDIVSEFQSRASVYETVISDNAGNSHKVIIDYAEYEKFLDKELNQAYRTLANKLDSHRKQELIQAQNEWLKFRDSEFGFINDNWNMEQFGSSSALSRGAYRSTIVKDRVVTLLNYLKNYPLNAK